MFINELESRLPDGFHDLTLDRFEIDYVQRTCTFTFHIEDETENKMVRLIVRGLQLCSVEPAYPTREYVPMKGPPRAYGSDTTGKEFNSLNIYKGLVGRDCFFYSFFLRSLNAFIHVAATDASLDGVAENSG